jgi:hypothetical protein
MLRKQKTISWPVLSTIADNIREVQPRFQTAIYLTTKTATFLAEYVVINPTPITLMAGVDCLIGTFTVAVKAAAG